MNPVVRSVQQSPQINPRYLIFLRVQHSLPLDLRRQMFDPGEFESICVSVHFPGICFYPPFKLKSFICYCIFCKIMSSQSHFQDKNVPGLSLWSDYIYICIYIYIFSPKVIPMSLMHPSSTQQLRLKVHVHSWAYITCMSAIELRKP